MNNDDENFLPELTKNLVCFSLLQNGIMGRDNQYPTCLGQICVNYIACCRDRIAAFKDIMEMDKDDKEKK